MTRLLTALFTLVGIALLFTLLRREGFELPAALADIGPFKKDESSPKPRRRRRSTRAGRLRRGSSSKSSASTSSSS
jgi:hypothetical protein